jgi:hypothetical protein
MMGSTIVMIAETDTFTINIKIGDNVRFGDKI